MLKALSKSNLFDSVLNMFQEKVETEPGRPIRSTRRLRKRMALDSVDHDGIS